MWMAGMLAFVTGLLVGILFTMGSIILSDRKKDGRVLKQIKDPDEWCMKGCRYWEECFGNHNDPDKAMDELVNCHCAECPVYAALEVLNE